MIASATSAARLTRSSRGDRRRLGDADAVAGRVADAGVDAVELVDRLLRDVDAAVAQALDRGAAVVDLEDQRWVVALGQDLTDLVAARLVHVRQVEGGELQ